MKTVVVLFFCALFAYFVVRNVVEIVRSLRSAKQKKSQSAETEADKGGKS